MASRDKYPPAAQCTTNAEDQLEAARLQARLRESGKVSGGTGHRLPSVQIADGAHKYVQIRASLNGEEQIFVTSKRGASYHRIAAEPLITKLEEAGYHDIEVAGGGRIFLDEDAKRISIFGFSYGFGKANHAISQQVVKQDPRFKDFDVTISDEGY